MLTKKHFKNIVEFNGDHYYISSCYTLDHGYETMIFPCDDNGNVTDWSELYAEWYDSETEMEKRHNEIVADLKGTFDNATEENKSTLSRLADMLNEM